MNPLATVEAELLASVLGRNDRTLGTRVDAKLDQASVIESLVDASESVLSTMCKITVENTRTSSGCAVRRNELSGVVGLTGALRAMVSINVSKDLIFHAAESLLGVRPTAMDADVIDLVGELANMIVGNAKERLHHKDLILGLPTVVNGTGHVVVFPKDMDLSVINFETNVGGLQIELGIKR
ncbi:MAG: chemotaxis protein CheX [Pirellulaceae bacterium]